MQNRKTRLCLSAGIADHIRISKCSRGYQLFLAKGFNSIQTIPQTGRKFKFQIIGCSQHLLTDVSRNGLIITCQQLSCLFRKAAVLCAGLPFRTPTGTLIHVVIQARTVLTNITGKLPLAVR